MAPGLWLDLANGRHLQEIRGQQDRQVEGFIPVNISLLVPCMAVSVILSWRPPTPIKWFLHGKILSILVAASSHFSPGLWDGNGYWGCQPWCISPSLFSFIIVYLNFPHIFGPFSSLYFPLSPFLHVPSASWDLDQDTFSSQLSLSLYHAPESASSFSFFFLTSQNISLNIQLPIPDLF